MVTWDAAKDQTILKGIFAFHDIKNSAPLLKFLADQIGEGCTPKAVGHRLANLRNSGKMVNSNSPGATPRKLAATARAPRTPKTPASGHGRAKASKKDSDAETTADDAEDDDEPIASPSIGRKRVRNSKAPATYAESDAATDEEEEFTPLSKRVKTEPVEDERIAGMANQNDPLEHEDEAVAFV